MTEIGKEEWNNGTEFIKWDRIVEGGAEEDEWRDN